MLMNIIFLVITLMAAYLIWKEEKRSFENWLYDFENNRELKIRLIAVQDFWTGLFHDPFRLVCLIAILVLQKSILSMILSVLFFILITYGVEKMTGCLRNIDWDEPKTNKIATALTVGTLLLRIADKIGFLHAILSFVTTITFSIVIIVVIYLVVTSRKKK